MAKVNISNVVVLDNPSPFQNPFQFEITFECLEDLPEGMSRNDQRKVPFVLRVKVCLICYHAALGD